MIRLLSMSGWKNLSKTEFREYCAQIFMRDHSIPVEEFISGGKGFRIKNYKVYIRYIRQEDSLYINAIKYICGKETELEKGEIIVYAGDNEVELGGKQILKISPLGNITTFSLVEKEGDLVVTCFYNKYTNDLEVLV